jgi:hypothetical protein
VLVLCACVSTSLPVNGKFTIFSGNHQNVMGSDDGAWGTESMGFLDYIHRRIFYINRKHDVSTAGSVTVFR